MKLHFLGTGAGVPSRQRNVSAIALQFATHGHWWLFDCGEATQHKLLDSELRLSRLTHIFITHLHGDHVYGLPGLLGSRSFQAPEVPLYLTGPSGIRQLITETLALSQTHLSYPLSIEELSPATPPPPMNIDGFTVTADWLNHVIPCLGYRIEEPEHPGKINVQLLTKLGLPPGPDYARLKRGENVIMQDGQIIHAKDVQPPPISGRVLTLIGDTAPCSTVESLASGCDWLVHEATFATAERVKAHQYGHSTSADAAQSARLAGAKQLLLTHISARYQEQSLEQLRAEAAAIFPAVQIAADGDIFTMP